MVAGNDEYYRSRLLFDFRCPLQHQGVLFRMGVIGVVPEQQHRVLSKRCLHHCLHHLGVILCFFGQMGIRNHQEAFRCPGFSQGSAGSRHQRGRQ